MCAGSPHLQIRKLSERMEKQGIRLHVEESAAELLAKKGYDPAYGARPLRRVIQSMLQNAVADKILEDKPGPDDVLEVKADEEKLHVEIRI